MTQHDMPRLNPLEWQAVSVALNDAAQCGCGSTKRPGRWARFLAWATGIEARRPLADPRLESLRAFVCAVRRRRREADALAPDLAAHGFNDRQIAALALLAA